MSLRVAFSLVSNFHEMCGCPCRGSRCGFFAEDPRFSSSGQVGASLWIVVVYVSNSERKQRARKTPLMGGLEGEPQTLMRIVGVVAGLLARGKWVRPQS